MKLTTFLLILLFGSVSPITETPVRLVAGTNEFPLKKPISALSSGAVLEVDVSAMLPDAELSIDRSRKWVEENISAGCLKAVLRGRATASSHLEFNGASAFAPGKVILILGSPRGVPVDEDFESLTLTSCKHLNKVTLHWRNYRL